MVVAKTPKEFFEKILPKRFKPEKAKDIDVIVNVEILGKNGGHWVVIIKNKELKIKEGSNASPSISLKINEKDYLDIVNGKLSGEKAFFSGKLNLDGDISQALRLKDAGLF